MDGQSLARTNEISCWHAKPCPLKIYFTFLLQLLGTSPPLIFDEPCPPWECFYCKPTLNYTVNDRTTSSSETKASSNGQNGNDDHTQVEADRPLSSGDEDGDKTPPTWCFENFDRTKYCWLKKDIWICNNGKMDMNMQERHRDIQHWNFTQIYEYATMER